MECKPLCLFMLTCDLLGLEVENDDALGGLGPLEKYFYQKFVVVPLIIQ